MVSCAAPEIPLGGSTTCTATVTDTDSGTKSAPLGTVSFSSNTTGGSFTPTSCALSPGTTSSSCAAPVTFSATAAATYTITGIYNPALGESHATSTGTTEVKVLFFLTIRRPPRPPLFPPPAPSRSCTATVTDTDSGTKSAPLGTVSFSS